MIVKKKNNMYTSKRKLIIGQEFVDTLKGIGNYIFQNKDLIAKPMLSAVGNVGALALEEGARAIIKKLARPSDILSPESVETLNRLSSPVGNIIGSGIKKF